MFILTTDFPISTDFESQYRPVVEFADNQFFAFWQDLRFYPSDRSIFAARIDQGGIVIDTNGVNLMRDRVVSADAAFDGTNFLVVVQDSC
jgi:predicted ribosome-associated RNA-binding protein Tma20